MKQHPTAIIDPEASIDDDVSVGPFAIIEGPVKIGSGTEIMARAHISGNTEIGRDNEIHIGAIVGYQPQHTGYKPCISYTKIGDRNIIREYATVHRSWEEGKSTIIGNDNLLMGLCHIAHDCIIGNKVIIANGALLGGHIEVHDGCFISGNALFHQFVKVGRLAMVSGGAGISKDIPPFCIATGYSFIAGINTVGLRRAGIPQEIRTRIKHAFKFLYRSNLNKTNALKKIREIEPCDEIDYFIDFLENSKRGICSRYIRKSEE
jgi:UDP-N-acetylglucosamine acyltransferase